MSSTLLPEGAASIDGCQVIWPSDGEVYDQARKDNNGDFDYYPHAIVKCRNEQDVRNAIRYADQYSIPLRIRSGGHNYEALSLADDAVIIDLSEMNAIHIEQGYVRVQSGARLGIVYEVLGDQGLTIPGGTCPYVRVGGVTQGGGVGVMHRYMGLTCDSLVEVRIVTADLQVIIATEDNEHKDLLWALKGGGGGNFGVVTEFTFRTHAVQEKVCIFSIVWPLADAEAVLKAWIDWAPQADERLTSIIRVYAPPQQTTAASNANNELPSPSEVTVLGMFFGSEEEYQAQISELHIMTPSDQKDEAYEYLPIKDAIQKLSGAMYGEETQDDPSQQPDAAAKVSERWVAHFSGNMAKPGAGVDEEQEWYKISSAFGGSEFQQHKDTVARLIVEQLKKSPTDKNFLSIHALGGKVSLLDPSATAFCHRNEKMVLQYQAFWNEQTRDRAGINKQWIHDFRTALLPYTTGAFINFVDVSIEDWPTAYYKDNFAKLREVKTKYDPRNLFHFQVSIPPMETTQQ